MLEQYLGLAGMLAIGILIVLVLYRSATRLQRKLGLESTADTPRTDAGGSGPGEPSARSTSRYFFIAIVGLTLHAGSIYFYLWGATIREAGLTGMVVMLGFGMCLIVGVFYSWARGAVTHAIESEAETRTD